MLTSLLSGQKSDAKCPLCHSTESHVNPVTFPPLGLTVTAQIRCSSPCCSTVTTLLPYYNSLPTETRAEKEACSRTNVTDMCANAQQSVLHLGHVSAVPRSARVQRPIQQLKVDAIAFSCSTDLWTFAGLGTADTRPKCRTLHCALQPISVTDGNSVDCMPMWGSQFCPTRAVNIACLHEGGQGLQR